MIVKATPESLRSYRDKRTPGATPEPFDSTRVTGGSVFVIHHHSARQLHYDLRLEVDGSLWSWAVPKGPSPDPAEKRLAVHVEPHPVDYAWFEGLIPEGNYGAGAMIVWDRGQWIALEDPKEGLEKGKLLFELRGFKLHGRWTLVRTGKGDSKTWLLIKERDHWVGRIPEPPMDSVLSGLTVDELKTGTDPQARLIEVLTRAGVAQRALDYRKQRPMLCKVGKPFSRDGWVFEVKYDGYRALAARDGTQVRLATRKGLDIGPNFPELSEAVAALPYRRFLLDGELVVAGADGLPSFSRLQQRAQLKRPFDVARAAVALPATYYAFDLLGFDDFDLRGLPLTERKAYLKELLPTLGPLRYVDHIETQGKAAWEHAVELGLEGLVGKKADSRYQEGERSADWVKLPALKTHDFAVIGYVPRPPDDFATLFVAMPSDNGWVYAGRVGSGTDAAARAEFTEVLDTLERADPCCEVADAPAEVTWVEARMTVRVRYKEFTRAGHLRQPTLLRLRRDKPAADLTPAPGAADLPEPVKLAPPSPRQRVILSNEDKVFWPGEGITKGAMLAHYKAIAEWMLPYLKDRPIVLTRYPDGIEGTSFFQHEAPDYLPQWIRTEPIQKSKKEKKRYILVEDEDTLLFIANLATIPIHIWSARVQHLDQPDYCILDLDPKAAPFADVIAVARELHSICEELALPHYIKTSGASGLHLLIPLGAQLDHDQATTFGELLARLCVKRMPDKATIQRMVEHRNDRVYVDYLQNGYGKTIAAPFCVRPEPGAPVSMPLRWPEVKAGLSPRAYHVGNAARRMRSLKADPMALVLTESPDIGAALEKIAALL